MVEPELPELEIVRRDLERDTAGRKVKSVDVKGLKSTPLHKNKKSLTSLLEGAKFVETTRVGMTIVTKLNNEHTLLMHPGDETVISRCPSRTAVAPNTQVIITFTQGGDLRFVDKGATGELGVVPTEELDQHLKRGRGLDLLADPVPWNIFGRFVLNSDQALKTFLTDPDNFVGIGDLYSDEILFDAGLMYDRPANKLSTQELRRLNRSITTILHDAIKYRGTTLEDRPWADIEGNPGSYAEHIAVYGKAGELSPRSRTPILKAKYKGHTVYYCSTQV
ncbi:MAG: DNA-formamidopyrimidine glycosylase family protein [Acidimicrobiales bacterium]